MPTTIPAGLSHATHDRLLPAAAFAMLLLAAPTATAAADDSRVPNFESDVAPILRTYCWKCHGGEGREARLDLRTLPLLLAGGKSGPAIVRGAAEQSLLFRKLAAHEMPPGDLLKPTDAHIETLRAWLEGGAPARFDAGPATPTDAPEPADEDRNWWAFRKPVRPPVPHVKAQGRVRTPIDAFVLRKLEQQGLELSSDAPAFTLARRLYLDLIGLPPAPAEVAAFLSDSSPNAYEKLVDRLLASPHYGERWGRHWLDAAGYVDTIGSDNDAGIMEQREGIWKYRDYVIRSFNNDKAYDRFLLEQIAGDELADWRGAEHFTPQIKELLVATGFLRQAADVTYAPELNTADIRHQVLYDTIQILCTNVLGLTAQCARCHDHKFDPISQHDYYALASLLAPAYDVQAWKHSKERFLWDVSAADKQRIDAHNAEMDRQIAERNGHIAALREPFRQKLLADKLLAVPEPIRADTKSAVETAAEKRNAVQRYLAEKLGPLLKVEPVEVDKALNAEAKRQQQDLQRQIGQLQSRKQSYGKIQALWDVGEPPPTFLYRRGDYTTPGAAVEPGVFAVLTGPELAFTIPETAPPQGSGRRTALARWLTRPEHPLTSRVIVNRVWQQYFGRGIAATPDNFGRSGAAPSHPELLDWLATEFVAGGWRFKKLHRLIVTSTVYRQRSSTGRSEDSTSASIDPEIRLLWRMPLRRLESEIIRDSILAVSGALDRTQGGPPIALKPNPDGSVEIDTAQLPAPAARYRRSLYIFARRNYQLSELNLFDQPIVSHNCTRRTSSAVVLQSLAMLNSTFVLEQAEHFARRVSKQAGTDQSARIQTAFRLALGRRPCEEELALSRGLLQEQIARYNNHDATQIAADAALTDLCQMLLNTNEFLYVQ